MKKSLLFLTVFVFGMLSCSKSDSIDNTPKNGSVTFWTRESSSTVTVTLRGVDKKITKYYPNYDPDCGASGCANYTDIPAGTYSYYAENYYGTYTWSGTVTVVSDNCTRLLLLFKKNKEDAEICDDENMMTMAKIEDDEEF